MLLPQNIIYFVYNYHLFLILDHNVFFKLVWFIFSNLYNRTTHNNVNDLLCLVSYVSVNCKLISKMTCVGFFQSFAEKRQKTFFQFIAGEWIEFGPSFGSMLKKEHIKPI